MQTHIITIYDELDQPYVVEAEVDGTRVIRIISEPKQVEGVSALVRYSDSGCMNDMRFGA